jgi:hypothetical protein
MTLWHHCVLFFVFFANQKKLEAHKTRQRIAVVFLNKKKMKSWKCKEAAGHSGTTRCCCLEKSKKKRRNKGWKQKQGMTRTRNGDGRSRVAAVVGEAALHQDGNLLSHI